MVDCLVRLVRAISLDYVSLRVVRRRYASESQEIQFQLRRLFCFWMRGHAAGCIRVASGGAADSFLGTITTVGSGLLTVKTDAGAEHKVTVPEGIKIQRIAPGAKDLSNAA